MMDRDFDHEKLRGLLRIRGWGVNDLWRALICAGENVCEATVRTCVSGGRVPHPRTVRIIARFFKVGPEYFFANDVQATVTRE